MGYGVPMTMDGLWGWCSHGDNGWFVGYGVPMTMDGLWGMVFP